MKLAQAPIRRKNCAFEELSWDTEYFGVPCAKLSITGPLHADDRRFLLEQVKNYRFVTLACAQELAAERQWIAENTSAFLADTNVHLVRAVAQTDKPLPPVDEQIAVCANVPPDPAIERLAETAFTHTRFLNDPHISKELSQGMYRIWVRKSFEKPDKFFSLAHVDGTLGGFIIFSSPQPERLRLELVAVSAQMRGQGLGTRLMDGVLHWAGEHAVQEIHVDTQLENLSAINYYIRNGFSPREIRYTYHLWQ